MSNEREMDAPATKRDVHELLRSELGATRQELRAEIAAAKQELRAEIAAAKQELRADLASKQDLQQLATELRAELASKQDLREAMAELRREWHQDFETWGGALHEQMRSLSGELARHTQAILEAMRSDIRVVDDQYKDLPARVTRLEAKVFAPRRRRTR